MLSTPFWLRDSGKLLVEYLVMGSAGIPAGIVYVALLRTTIPRVEAVAVGAVVGTLIGTYLRTILHRRLVGQRVFAPHTAASATLSWDSPSRPYTLAAACLVITMLSTVVTTEPLSPSSATSSLIVVAIDQAD